MVYIKVREVMSKHPLMLADTTSVLEAAKAMTQRNVSTIIVLATDNNICGIVTEHDFMVKVVAQDLDTKTTTLKTIMSAPVTMISADESLADAAELMVKKKIRKLPVIENNNVIGILSENDVVRIAPDLLLIVKERQERQREGHKTHPVHEHIAGRCEICGKYSTNLAYFNGMFICEECRESQ